jgi:hypothetical protein
MAVKARGAYWVEIASTIMFALVTIALAVIAAANARTSWRYHHAPPCSETVRSDCRDQILAHVADIRSDDLGGYFRQQYELITADYRQIQVNALPKQWRISPDHGLAVTLERFDGSVFTVSAMGIIVRSTDNPDEYLPALLPGVPAMAGLAWYGGAFAKAGRGATDRTTRTRLRWAEWLRRVALAVVTGALAAVGLTIFRLRPSLAVALTTEAAVTVAALAGFWWRHHRRAATTSGSETQSAVSKPGSSSSP